MSERPMLEIQKNLQVSREHLKDRGLPRDARRFVNHHPRAIDAVEAALAGDPLEPDTLVAGPRIGHRDGWACERVDGRWCVVYWGPAEEVAGTAVGEQRDVMWTAGETT